jgi:hypothetical protein
MSKCKGLDNSLSYIARYIHGRPIHAVVGFSQGAALGGTICSMLECANNPQKVASIRSQNLPVDVFLRLPGQKQLRFYIGIAGFRAYVYESLYQFPLQTPSCHAIAKFDTMVEHSYTMDLARSFDGSETVHFYGSHYTPRDPATVDFMAAFAARHACGETAFLFPPPSPTSQADSDEDSVTARSDQSVRLFPNWVKSRRTNNVTVGGRLAVAPTIRRVRSFNW